MTVGINPGVTQYPVPQKLYVTQQVMNWIKQAGFTQVRPQLNMSFIWRNQGDTWQLWDWSPLDDVVYKANQLNLRVSFPIRGLPAWGLLNPLFQSTNEPWFLDDPHTVLTCAAGVVQRYNGVYNIPGYGPLVIADVELANEQENIHFTSSTTTFTLGAQVTNGVPTTSIQCSGVGTALLAGTMLQFGTSGGTGDIILCKNAVNVGDTNIPITNTSGGTYVPTQTALVGSDVTIVYQGLRSSPYYEYNGQTGVFNNPPPVPQPARDPYYHQQTLLIAAPPLRSYYPWNTFGQIGTGAAWWWQNDNYRDFFAGLGSALGLVDYANCHIYSNARDPLVPGGGQHNPGLTTILSNIATGCSQAGYPNLPLRVSEIGWSVPSDAATYAIQAARFQEVFPVFQSNYSLVQQVDIFTIDDTIPSPGSSIVLWDGTKYTFTAAYTYLSNLIASTPEWGPIVQTGENGRMPFDALVNADNFRVSGSLTVVNDPGGNAGNVNVQGTHVVSGTASFASGVTISSLSAGTVTGIGTMSGGFTYDVITGGLPATTTLSQSLSTGSQINMTSGVSAGGVHVVYVSAASTTATVALTPTSSASTSGVYQNGLEVTVINLGASASNVLLPTSSAGNSQQVPVTITAGCGITFKYVAQLQTWIPLAH
jgi:hypothetical protein